MAFEKKANSDGPASSKDEPRDDLSNVTLFKVSLRDISLVTLMLPLSGLFICFITGYIFQAEEIHETHCRVSVHV
jgi:hypothetical protein